MTEALVRLGLAIIYVLGAVLLFDSVVFLFDRDRARELMALQAGLVHSIRRRPGAPHRHHRRSDRVERGPHEHQRVEDDPGDQSDRSMKLSHRAPPTRHSPARPSMLMTIRQYIRPAPDPARHSAEDEEGDR